MVSGLEFACDQLQSSPAFGVLVSHSKKGQGMLYFKAHCRSPRYKLFSPEMLRRGAGFAMNLRHSLIGDCLMEQCSGAPIGGPFTGALCDASLAKSETNWKHDRARRESLGFWYEDNMCACSRYEDDLVTASRMICTSCIIERTEAIYPKESGWEHKSTRGQHPTSGKLQSVAQPWLDMILHPDQDGNLEHSMHLREQDWRLCKKQTQQKQTIPPFISNHLIDQHSCKGRISCKYSRFNECRLSKTNLFDAIFHEIQLWYAHGYSQQHLKTFFLHHRTASNCCRIASYILRHYSHNGNHLQSIFGCCNTSRILPVSCLVPRADVGGRC